MHHILYQQSAGWPEKFQNPRGLGPGLDAAKMMEIARGLRLRAEHRHARFGAPERALGQENPVNLRVLVLVFDLSATLFDVFSRILEVFDIELETPGFKREITRRLWSGVEMLMPPLHRWHEHAHAPPFHAALSIVFAFRPKVRISRAGEHNDMGARAMAMRFFVFADGEFRKVSAHRIIDELE